MDEASLKALKVPELKEMLTAAGLPAVGNKPDLIKTLLANPAALDNGTAGSKKTVASTQVVSEVPAESAALTKQEDTKATAIDDPAPTATNPDSSESTAAAPAELTPAEKEARTNDELEKRKKRAERFGGAADTDDKTKARAERFGTAKPDEKVSQALDKLDQALPEKRERKGKKEKAATSTPAAAQPTKSETSKSAASPAKLTTAPVAKKQIDPAVKAADEEKKRKREERFNDAAKKPKV